MFNSDIVFIIQISKISDNHIITTKSDLKEKPEHMIP